MADSLPKPRRDDHPEDAKRVGELRGLLGLAGGAAHHGDGDLLEAQLALEALEDYLVGVEAVLAQVELVELGDPDGAVTVRAVGDLDARKKRDQTREEHDPHVADAPRLLVVTHEPGAEHEVRPALDYGPDEPIHLLRLVLAVGVQVDDDQGLLGLRYGEAGSQGVPLTAVD